MIGASQKQSPSRWRTRRSKEGAQQNSSSQGRLHRQGHPRHGWMRQRRWERAHDHHAPLIYLSARLPPGSRQLPGGQRVVGLGGHAPPRTSIMQPPRRPAAAAHDAPPARPAATALAAEGFFVRLRSLVPLPTIIDSPLLLLHSAFIQRVLPLLSLSWPAPPLACPTQQRSAHQRGEALLLNKLV